MPLAAIQGLVHEVDAWIDPMDRTFISSVMLADTWKGKHYTLQPYYGLYTGRKGGKTLNINYDILPLQQAGVEDPFECYQRGGMDLAKINRSLLCA